MAMNDAAQPVKTDAAALIKMAESALQAGNPKEAASHYADAARICLPKHDREATDERINKAATLAQKSLSLNKHQASAHFVLGMIAGTRGSHENAIKHLSSAVTHSTDNPKLHYLIAANYDAIGQYENVVQHCDLALKQKPGLQDAMFLKAVTLERMNRLAEAREMLDTLLATYPDHAEAHYAKARMERRSGNPREAENALKEIIQRHPENYKFLNEYARLLDKLGRYDEAYEACRKAKQLWHQQESPKVNGTGLPAQLIKASQSYFTPEQIKGWPPHFPTDGLSSPTFLVGFPRSGTTLTEQILSSHPKLSGTQEESTLDTLIYRYFLSQGHPYPACLSQLSADDITVLRKAYWQLIEQYLGSEAKNKHIIDELPLNLMHLGFVNRIFPESRILVLIRDPRDAILSNFMQLYQPNSTMIEFHSLESITRFYEQVMNLWLHYRQTLPLSIYQFRYEDLVDHLEDQINQILQFLQEDWHDDIMNYHTIGKNRYVSTPSFEGVMKPVYKDAVGRWTHYAKHFEPYLPKLQPFVKAFGYEGISDSF